MIDDLVVPPEYERHVISAWGERPFPNPDDFVGFNADYTGNAPWLGTNDGLLWTNHEYVSYPLAEICPEAAIRTPAANTAQLTRRPARTRGSIESAPCRKLKRCVTRLRIFWQCSACRETPRDFEAPNARFRGVLSR